MKYRHNNRQDQPIANATDDLSGTLIHTCTLAPQSAPQQTARLQMVAGV
ncbi:MAG: hypothetical protein U9Q37_02080 [Euryarchaeota archaeon]|nr:hypothetical protein [Euryarchaeota archaeon]